MAALPPTYALYYSPYRIPDQYIHTRKKVSIQLWGGGK